MDRQIITNFSCKCGHTIKPQKHTDWQQSREMAKRLLNKQRRTGSF